MKSLALSARLFAVLLLPMSPAFSQEAAPPKAPSDAVRLEDFPEKLVALDGEITRKLDEVRALVDREATAKTITEPIAQSLRWSLRTTALAGSVVDVRSMISTMRVPTDNSALTQAIKELETTYAAVQTRHAALASGIAREARQRVSDAIRTAGKPSDLDALETHIAKASEALGRRANSLSSEAANSLLNAQQVLRGLRRLIDAELAGKPEVLGQAMNRLRNDYRSSSEASFEGEVAARIDRTMQPFVTAAEKAEEEAAAALSEVKPRAEIEAALEKLDDAADRLIALRQNSGSYTQQRDPKQVAASYHTIARVTDALADGEDENVGTRMNEARNAARQIAGKRAVGIEAMLAKLEVQLADKFAKMTAERGEKLRARIVAAKQPSDLNEIAGDVRRWENAASRSGRGGNENWSQLASQLGTLSVAWSTNSPALLQQERLGGTPFSGELAALEKRVERDVLSRALGVPELNTPPLSEKPADAALDAVTDGLAEKGEWRRLYEMLKARAALQTNGGRRSEDDALMALRSFFTAQNLELAEQWPEAVQSYKAVLQCASPRAPIKPAAERIKVLVKEHPEVSKVAAPPVRPGFPEQFER